MYPRIMNLTHHTHVNKLTLTFDYGNLLDPRKFHGALNIWKGIVNIIEQLNYIALQQVLCEYVVGN